MPAIRKVDDQSVDRALQDVEQDAYRTQRATPLSSGDLAGGAVFSRTDITLKVRQPVLVFTGNQASKVTLPPAKGLKSGVCLMVVVENRGQAVLTVRPNSGDTLGSGPSGKNVGLIAGQTALFVSDGTANWGVQLIGSVGDDWVRSQAATSGAETWYYANSSNNAALAAAALTAAQLYAMPFIAPKRLSTIDRLGFNCTTLVAASNARIGLYANVGGTDNPYPGSLLFDSGDISTGSTGAKTATISPALPLIPGALYWIVLHNSAAISVNCLSAAGGVSPLLGITNALGTTTICGLQNAQAYGALPAVFPGASANITAAPIPALARRYAT